MRDFSFQNVYGDGYHKHVIQYQTLDWQVRENTHIVRVSRMSLWYGMYIVLHFVHLYVNSTVALTVMHKTQQFLKKVMFTVTTATVCFTGGNR